MNKKLVIKVLLFFPLSIICLSGIKNTNSRVFKTTDYIIDYNERENTLEKYRVFKKENNGNNTSSYRICDSAAKFFEIEQVSYDETNDLNNKELNFEIETFDKAGVIDFNVSLVDTTTNDVEKSQSFHGFVIEKDDLTRTLLIDFGGMYAEASIENGHTLINVTHDNPEEGSGGSDFIPVISKIGLQIASQDDVQTLINDAMANKLLIPPPLLPSNGEVNLGTILPYIFYNLKYSKARNNYIKNTQVINNYEDSLRQEEMSVFDNYINDQEMLIFNNLIWGLTESTITHSGCPVIALYNAMIDSWKQSIILNNPIEKPDFASLVFLFELCNANLAESYFGVLPGDKHTFLNTPGLQNTINQYIDNYYPKIYPYAHQIYLDINFWELQLVITPLGGILAAIFGPAIVIKLVIEVETIKKEIKEFLNDPNRFVHKFIEWYLDFVLTEGDMLSLIFGKYAVNEYPRNDFHLLKYHFRNARRGIICYWNSFNPDTGEIDAEKMMHYIYVNKFLENGTNKILYRCYNSYGADYLLVENKDLNAFMCKSLQDNYDNSGQFSWGYLIND